MSLSSSVASDVPGAAEPRPPGVPDAGRRALLVIGSRVAGLYLAGVVLASMLSPPHASWGRWLVAVVVVLIAAAGVVRALSRPMCWRGGGVLAALSPGPMLAIAIWHPSLNPHDVQLLVGASAAAIAAGVGLSWGPGVGLLATAWLLAWWWGAVRLVEGGLEGVLFAAALAGGLLGSTASLILRRGYTLSQRALAAAEEAVTARAMAAARWTARRSEIRTLHDTVLSTLSLLAQGGHGVGDAALRADCQLQVELLRATDVTSAARRAVPVSSGNVSSGNVSSGNVSSGNVSSGGAHGAGAAPVADPFERIARRWAARSLEVRVYGTSDALRLEGVSARASGALLAAVEECLENVRRHAGVAVATVSVSRSGTQVRCTVTDEGRGFDARDPSIHGIGLGDSVLGRVQEQGGGARVWSAPGRGTSVALSVPLADFEDDPTGPTGGGGR